MIDDAVIRKLDFEILEIKPGDVFVVMVQDKISYPMKNLLVQELKEYLPKNTRILVINGGVDIGIIRGSSE